MHAHLELGHVTKMFSLQLSCWILLCVAYTSCVNIVPCALNDEQCMTQSAQKSFKTFVNGIKELGVASSDPLHQDQIKAELPTVNYTLTDANLYGMKDCSIHQVKRTKETALVVLYVCPRLTMISKYEINGKLGTLDVDGKGDYKVVHDDFHIAIYADVEKLKDVEGIEHLNIQSFTLGMESKVVIYDIKNLYNGDKEKAAAAHKYLNENWKTVNEIIQEPAMYAFMGKFVENMNSHLSVVPANEVFVKST